MKSIYFLALISLTVFVGIAIAESFLVKSVLDNVDSKAKKYSVIYDELLEGNEALLYRYSQLIREMTVAMEHRMDALRKLAENVPRASRKSLLKDLALVNKQLEDIGDLTFL